MLCKFWKTLVSCLQVFMAHTLNRWFQYDSCDHYRLLMPHHHVWRRCSCHICLLISQIVFSIVSKQLFLPTRLEKRNPWQVGLGWGWGWGWGDQEWKGFVMLWRNLSIQPSVDPKLPKLSCFQSLDAPPSCSSATWCHQNDSTSLCSAFQKSQLLIDCHLIFRTRQATFALFHGSYFETLQVCPLRSDDLSASVDTAFR